MVSSRCRVRRGLLFLFALAITALLAPGAGVAAPGFDREETDLERKRAYDVGVADYNGDGALDLFSTNHMFKDSLLRGDGTGGFDDAYDDAGFGMNPDLPGVEDITQSPKIDDRGFYMWAFAGDRRPNLRLATTFLPNVPGFEGDTVKGRIVVSFPKVKIRRQRRAEVEVVQKSKTRTVIRFEMKSNAAIALRPNHIALPFRTIVDDSVPTDRIFVGPRAVNPPEHEFSITLGDRHGVAWADFNRDAEIDAFISHGGTLSGNSKLAPRLGSDELLLGEGEALSPAPAGTGLRKGTCRGREAQSIDYDDDGSLDLFLGCRQGRPRLYLGNGDGTFTERRRAFRKVGNRATANRWLDITGDRLLELVQAGKFEVRVYEIGRSGRVRLHQRLDTPNEDKNVEALAPGDFDNDGDLDIFMAAPSGNALLVNRRGRLSVEKPASYGLPRTHGSGAAWVDFDNDSRLDLYVSPDGLFRNVGDSFRKVGTLRSKRRPRYTRATWFDADGDGRRDLLRVSEVGRGLFPEIALFRNRRPGSNHWLELDLVGTRGNRQAIGARVTARVGRRTLTQWVGQNEGSRYGQGHYRLYFGLGRHERARRVTVRWPDGKRTRLGTVGGDRIKTVER